MDQVCRGFFLDARHMESHFEYLTESPPLNGNVEKYLRSFLGVYILRFTDNIFHMTLIFRSPGAIPDGCGWISGV